MRNGEDLNFDDILHSLEKSLVLSGSAFNTISQIRRQRFKTVLSSEYSTLVNANFKNPSNELFGSDIAERVEKHSKEQKIIRKISKPQPFPQSSRPSNIQPNQNRGGSNANKQNQFPRRKVFFKRNHNYQGNKQPEQSKPKVKH